jgi:hypothetical protein
MIKVSFGELWLAEGKIESFSFDFPLLLVDKTT